MKNLRSLFLLLATWVAISSCAITPTYRLEKVEYCKKIQGIVYCDNGVYDAGGYNRGIYE